MRFLAAALFGAGVLASQFASAGTPASSVEQIGAVQAALAFCSKVDSKDSKQLEQAARRLLPDMTEARVAAVRNTAGYQKAYQTIDSVLKGIAPSDAVRLCTSATHEPKAPEPKPGHRR